MWFGERFIKLCFVMDSVFFFQYYFNYNVNVGNNLFGRVKRVNIVKEGMRNILFLLQDFDGVSGRIFSKFLFQILDSFLYADILEGVRGERGFKGFVERVLEEFLIVLVVGDCFKVRSLIESGKVNVDVVDKIGYIVLFVVLVSIVVYMYSYI